jgi:hypothetical protein
MEAARGELKKKYNVVLYNDVMRQCLSAIGINPD